MLVRRGLLAAGVVLGAAIVLGAQAIADRGADDGASEIERQFRDAVDGDVRVFEWVRPGGDEQPIHVAYFVSDRPIDVLADDLAAELLAGEDVAVASTDAGLGRPFAEAREATDVDDDVTPSLRLETQLEVQESVLYRALLIDDSGRGAENAGP